MPINIAQCARTAEQFSLSGQKQQKAQGQSAIHQVKDVL
jgi:hypothetical protein